MIAIVVRSVTWLVLVTSTQAIANGDWEQAIIFDRLDVIRLQVSNGQAVDAPAPNGKTALMAAAKRGDRELMDELMRRGADVNAKNHKGGTVLMYAVLSADTGVVAHLLDARAEVNQQTTTGWSALTIAAVKDFSALVAQLLRHGAEINQQDIYGWTPLMRATHEGLEETAHLLIEQDAVDLNLQDESGFTALHHAAFSGHRLLTESLMTAGARIDVIDGQGRTAQKVAIESGNHAIASLLAPQ